MADPHLKTTLERKAQEIEARLDEYRRLIEEQQADLVYLRGTISLFEREKVPRSSPYVSLVGVFRRGEAFEIIRKALREHPGGLDTGELAVRCLETKGLDAQDKIFRRSMMQTIAQMMQIHRRSGHVASIGKRGLTCVWALSNG